MQLKRIGFMAAGQMPGKMRKQYGVSLIEVMVTVLVLSIGLLGIAALQFMSKRSNFEAVQRTTATMLVYDIIERMRMNPMGLGSYASAGAAVGSGTTSEPSPNCSAGNPCNANELAVHDAWAWEQALLGAAEVSGTSNTGGLVSPTGCITADAAAPGHYSIAIAWRGSTELSDPTNAANPAYACGRDTGAVGTGKYDSATAKNTHRRLLVIDTYISPI